jgi:4-hydroxy-tetrahydrodipicolinate synthase
MKPRISWEGVFPAVTTQFNDDLSLNIDATARVMDGLIRDGVSGLIVCGSVGENTSLERKKKFAIMETAKSVAAGRVPVLCGIAEFTTAFAVETGREAARVGIDGVMVMPALVYSSKPHETAAHFRSVASATDLPVMLYNNPPIYKNDVTPDILVTGTALTRPPRLALLPNEKAEVEAIMAKALKNRPLLPNVGLKAA